MASALITTAANFVYATATTISTVTGAGLASSVAIVNSVLSAGLKLALLSGASAVARNQNKPEAQGQLISLAINSAEPRRILVGKRATGGVLVDWYTTGERNKFLYLVIALCDGPTGPVTRIWGGGRTVYSSPLSHGVQTEIPEYRSGGPRLWVTHYDGRVGQSADVELAGATAWSANHVGEGVSYVIVKCQWDSDTLTQPPQLTFELEGATWYDRRKDTSAGGSGAHRLDDPSTWEFTDNPAVVLDHYLLGRYWGGQLIWGPGLEPEDLPFDRFAALANLCEESVALSGTGSQQRYAANGFLFADREHRAQVEELCQAMNAEPVDLMGRVAILDNEPKTPVMTIDDGDLLEGEPDTYSPKVTISELVSGVDGQFQDPAQRYQPVPYPRVQESAWTEEDPAENRIATLDLPFETDVERAQRLAWLYGKRQRRQATLSGASYPRRALKLEPGDWFVRTGRRFGDGGKTFQVRDIGLDLETMRVSIVAREVDPSDTAWDETTARAGPVAGEEGDKLIGLEVPALSLAAYDVTSANATIPAIRVTWPLPDDTRVKEILIQVAPVAGDGSEGPVTSFVADPGSNDVLLTQGIVDNTDYAVRARFIGPVSNSNWTGTYAITTGGSFSIGEPVDYSWDNITGANKPADNADVTAVNVAAGITGQGWGATAAEADANNALQAWLDVSGSGRPDDNADVTGANIAAGFSGQDWGATASQSRADNFQQGWAYVSGSGRPDDYADVTINNVAAGFSGQGGLATENAVSDFDTYYSGFKRTIWIESLFSDTTHQSGGSLNITKTQGLVEFDLEFEFGWEQYYSTEFNAMPDWAAIEIILRRDGTYLDYRRAVYGGFRTEFFDPILPVIVSHEGGDSFRIRHHERWILRDQPFSGGNYSFDYKLISARPANGSYNPKRNEIHCYQRLHIGRAIYF